MHNGWSSLLEDATTGTEMFVHLINVRANHLLQQVHCKLGHKLTGSLSSFQVCMLAASGRDTFAFSSATDQAKSFNEFSCQDGHPYNN